MLRAVLLGAILLSISLVAAAQADIQKLVDTEHAFAQLAADKNTREAFLANMNDDALVFTPDRTDAKPYWTARSANTALLSWAPNFADVSSNGILGYTTGNLEYRADRTNGTPPSAFGDFITLWQRQPDGRYKWVIDIGTTHEKPEKYSTDWKTSVNAPAGKAQPTGDAPAGFYQVAAASGVVKAYETFADDNIRSYREEKLPILGKKNALSVLKADKNDVVFAKRSTTLASADLAYNLNTYTRSKGGKAVEKGNYLQIWKFYGGKWHIVLDIFKPIPA